MSPRSLEARAKRMSAARARRLARNLFDDDRRRVLQFADDLEAEALALDHAALQDEVALTVPPVIERQQPQQQQQQQAGEKKGPPPRS